MYHINQLQLHHLAPHDFLPIDNDTPIDDTTENPIYLYEANHYIDFLYFPSISHIEADTTFLSILSRTVWIPVIGLLNSCEMEAESLPMAESFSACIN